MRGIEKKTGRKAGRGGISVPKSAYPEIYRLHQSGLICAADIGKKFDPRRAASGAGGVVWPSQKHREKYFIS
jgi:hypothetical protein